jgi:AcrR family transcriptional regulator
MLLGPAWEGVEDPLERVFALLARYRELLVHSRFGYGCPIGSLALELHEPDPPVRELLAANFRAWRDAVQRCLDEAGFAARTDTGELATLVLAIMEGAVMQARTFGEAAAFDACVAQLRALLASWARRQPVRRRRKTKTRGETR